MKLVRIVCVSIALIAFAATSALAHFGMVIPDKDEVTQSDKNLHLVLSFSHPFEGIGMDLEKPATFAVYQDGKAQDLLPGLKQTKVMDHQAWESDFAVKRPGMYVFFMEPKPYPEPAENNYIIHYTKTVVDAFEGGEEWNQPIGVKTEIVPLTRPFGNYAGNVFQGVVLLDGKPVPYSRVEVEFYNKDGKRNAPNGRMITQEVLADGNGVFTFACPWQGWWGFAALNDADYKIEGKDVELGAVLWIEMQ
ncbi:DUF4198 domain-containing protein [Paucidesulfovibrio longus]|uniref:DUF4198 domain-containing protein n=1 Tax=Paucidesulfovibrio longus TaxID=889 RepID=UPI0003B40399|nr:DUF4198 domain-containing protein [Paucidesulfovibrio longus]